MKNNKEYGLGIVIQDFNPDKLSTIKGETLKFSSKDERDIIRQKIEDIIKPYIVKI